MKSKYPLVMRIEDPCPNCGENELFDATVTTEHPELYSKYSYFRGGKHKRLFCCFNCKTIARYKKNKDTMSTSYGKLEFVSYTTPTEESLEKARLNLSGEEQAFS